MDGQTLQIRPSSRRASCSTLTPTRLSTAFPSCRRALGAAGERPSCKQNADYRETSRCGKDKQTGVSVRECSDPSLPGLCRGSAVSLIDIFWNLSCRVCHERLHASVGGRGLHFRSTPPAIGLYGGHLGCFPSFCFYRKTKCNKNATANRLTHGPSY